MARKNSKFVTMRSNQINLGRSAIRVVSLVLVMTVLASCASQRSPYRKKRKCDCPSWSKLELVEPALAIHPSNK